jgi:iron(III) transport system ATP-binding protein
VLVSLRPQAMAILTAAPADDSLALRATIAERTYLGEAWDYVLRPEGTGLRLRAAAPPLEAHAVGAQVWLRIDPAQVAVVE